MSQWGHYNLSTELTGNLLFVRQSLGFSGNFFYEPFLDPLLEVWGAAIFGPRLWLTIVRFFFKYIYT